MPRCAWGLCNSDSRYNEKGRRPRPSMVGVTFLPFPKPKTKLERCKAWIKACGRENFTISNITQNTYVCSKHFRDGRPSELYPDPYPALPNELSQQMQLKRLHSKQKKQGFSRYRKVLAKLESPTTLSQNNLSLSNGPSLQSNIKSEVESLLPVTSKKDISCESNNFVGNLELPDKKYKRQVLVKQEILEEDGLSMYNTDVKDSKKMVSISRVEPAFLPVDENPSPIDESIADSNGMIRNRHGRCIKTPSKFKDFLLAACQPDSQMVQPPAVVTSGLPQLPVYQIQQLPQIFQVQPSSSQKQSDSPPPSYQVPESS